MKQCKKCLISKPENEFGNNKNNIDGKSIYCKQCELDRFKKYRENNREKVNESSKKWRDNNPEKYKETTEKYLKSNPHMTSSERIKRYRENEDFIEKEKIRRKEYYKNNVEKIREYRKKYYQDNKGKERLRNNKYKSVRLKNDPVERAKKNIRDRVRQYLVGENKGKRTFEIIGLDKEGFKTYIENMFTNGMCWENYGEWHIDHIKPLCLAKTNEEIIKLNHYTNLQPLWGEDNIKKNRKYDD